MSRLLSMLVIPLLAGSLQVSTAAMAAVRRPPAIAGPAIFPPEPPELPQAPPTVPPAPIAHATHTSRQRAVQRTTPMCPWEGTWQGLVRCLWGPRAPEAFRVVACESGGNPNATGARTRWGRAVGVFQILPNGSYDPETNVRQAWAKFSRAGWSPWVCKP